MMRAQLEPRFVETIPQEPEDGILYTSIKFRTTVHLCACGCGEKVVAKLSPLDWALTFDGKTVSLSPSIGNWTFPCRSHYFVKKNMVLAAGDMSDDQIKAGREANARSKRNSMTPYQIPLDANNLQKNSEISFEIPKRRNIVQLVSDWLKGLGKI